MYVRITVEHSVFLRHKDYKSVKMVHDAEKGGKAVNKYHTIKTIFKANTDEENAIKMSSYMRDKFKFYGIPTPKRKLLYRELLKAEKVGCVIDWDFLDACYNDEYREMQYLVMDYLAAMQKLLQYDDVSKIEKYIRKKQWWDTIDGFDRILGDIAFTDYRINGLMLKWSTDTDFWVRRIAIDHQLNRKDKTDRKLLEKILVNNLGSDEFFINKAIGWSLRDYSKTNPEWVRSFLEVYGDRMDKLSIKEAGKYI